MNLTLKCLEMKERRNVECVALTNSHNIYMMNLKQKAKLHTAIYLNLNPKYTSPQNTKFYSLLHHTILFSKSNKYSRFTTDVGNFIQ